VQLKRAPLRFAREGDSAVPADLDRTAGITTLAGCSTAILAAFLPSVEKAAFGVSLTTMVIQGAGILLAVLAMISAGIASVVLLRRPATAGVAIILIVLALGQLGLAIWDGVNIVHAIDQVDSRQVLISAIGTGAYLGVLGSVITLAGGILAWTTRRRG
jgi:hypothetical protein